MKIERAAAIAMRGEVVFVECAAAMSSDQLEAVRMQLKKGLAETGVTVVVLPHGMKVARVEPAPEPAHG